MTKVRSKRAARIGAAVGVVSLLVGVLFYAQVSATHQPADKVAVTGSALTLLGTPTTAGATSDVHTILSGTLKSSNPTDLVFSVTAECALWTDIKNVRNSDSTAVASVKVWVEVDGNVVPVYTYDPYDTGKVVFCNRHFQMKLSGVEDENTTIETFLRTRSANAFNWVLTNVGSGVHSIEVKALLQADVSGDGYAQAAIGKRTLVVEPVKLASDVTI